MKITKRQLRRIIKEEHKKVLKETNARYKRRRSGDPDQNWDFGDDVTQGRAGLDGFGDGNDSGDPDQNWDFGDDVTQGRAALKEAEEEGSKLAAYNFIINWVEKDLKAIEQNWSVRDQLKQAILALGIDSENFDAVVDPLRELIDSNKELRRLARDASAESQSWA